MDKELYNSVIDHAGLGKVVEAKDGTRYALVPSDFSLDELQDACDPNEKPGMRSGGFATDSPEGFIEYFNRVKNEEQVSIIFADRENDMVKAFFDFHGGTDAAADRCAFTARLGLKTDPLFDAWYNKDGSAFTQEKFAEFLEDYGSAIREPDAASVAELVMDLEQTGGVEFKSRKNLTTGAVELHYVDSSEVKAPGDIEVPKVLHLMLPIYRGGEPVPLTASMRYRLSGQALAISYRLVGLNEAYEQAFQSVVDHIGEKTSIVPIPGVFRLS